MSFAVHPATALVVVIVPQKSTAMGMARINACGVALPRLDLGVSIALIEIMSGESIGAVVMDASANESYWWNVISCRVTQSKIDK